MITLYNPFSLRKKFTFPAFLFILVLGSVQQAWTAVPIDEKTALVALYLNTDGSSWTNNSGWADHATTDPCDDNWYGITCDETLSNVTMLQIENNNLSGPIPPLLENLSKLSKLHLSFNKLTGPIPPELANLNQLRELHLRENLLSGIIPTELGNLSNLTQLSLYDNRLNGSIPSQLSELKNLTSLRLHKNSLTGPIPPELANLRKLSRLHLSNNKLSGSIPAELGNLINLTELFLATNVLSGTIPPEIDQLTALTRLSLDGNALSGTIPTEIGTLDQLRYLSLNNNNLSGTIPDTLATLGQLEQLLLYSNDLTGSIPQQLGSLSQLTTLRLQNNSLSGIIPAELGNLSNLQTLHLSGNALSGPIPKQLGTLNSLEELFIKLNGLCGMVPSALTNLINLTDGSGLELDSNSLRTTIDQTLDHFITLKSGSDAWKTTQSVAECDTFPIYSSTGTGGTVVPLGQTLVEANDSQRYSIIASKGYRIADVKIDGTSLGAVSSYTFADVAESHSISATFTQETFIISSSNDANGNITPLGNVEVGPGDSITFTITPDPDFQIADIKVDGNSVGARVSYTFSDVASSHSIHASFTLFSGSHYITPSAGSNGTISPSATESFDQGTSQRYIISPDIGFHVDGVLIDGLSVGSATSYTFNNISENHTISAHFANGSYYSLSVITRGTGSGNVVSSKGDIDCPGICDIQFEPASTIILEAIPDNGSTFIGWRGDCTGTTATCFLSGDQNKYVSAEFSSFPWPTFLPAIRSNRYRQSTQKSKLF